MPREPKTAAAPAPDLAKLRLTLARVMDGTVGKKNPRPAMLDDARAAALEAAAALRGPDGKLAQKSYEALDDELSADLRAWLLELPSFLSKKGRKEQGLELCDLYAPIFGAPYLDAERAIVLWESGARDEGRAALEQARARHADHCWPELRSGYLSEQEKDAEAARKHYERSVELARASGDERDLRFAWDGRVQFHHARGEREKAVELSKEMLEECPELEEELKVETIVNEQPKVGRNDPCPCGSGKKFKKCCGAKA